MNSILPAVVLLALSLPLAAADSAMETAFAHYERIQAALANDTVEGVATNAKDLAAIKEIGPDASKLAADLAGSKDLERARTTFGALSEALVPKFLEAGIKGIDGYFCSMKNARWAQRTGSVKNPYYGKSMLTCGQKIDQKK